MLGFFVRLVPQMVSMTLQSLSHFRFRLLGILLVSAALFEPILVSADQVPVRHMEGLMHGFLALRTLDGKSLAECSDIMLYLAGVNGHAGLRIIVSKRWRLSHFLGTIQFFSTVAFTSQQPKATYAISSRDCGPNA